jgi:hypothetical protein
MTVAIRSARIPPGPAARRSASTCQWPSRMCSPYRQGTANVPGFEPSPVGNGMVGAIEPNEPFKSVELIDYLC